MNARMPKWFRKNNQHGFILPLTMIVSFLLFAFLLHEIKMVQTEKQFLHEREKMLATNDLLQMASVDLGQRFSVPIPDKQGVIKYQEGQVNYQIIDDIKNPPPDISLEDVIYVQLTATTDGGGKHISYAYYDKKNGKTIRWVEVV